MLRLLLALLLMVFVPAVANAASPIDSTNMTFDPGHGTQVEYLSARGGAYLWYPGNAIILAGQWKTQGTSQICFKYGPNTYNPVTHVYGDVWECEAMNAYTSHLVDQAKGDVFRLAKRRAAPFPLSRDQTTLAQLAQQIRVGVEHGEISGAKPGKLRPVTQGKAGLSCAAAIADAGTSSPALAEAAIGYYYGGYRGRKCLAVDYGKALALLKEAGETSIYKLMLADLRDRAASGDRKAAAALAGLGAKP